MLSCGSGGSQRNPLCCLRAGGSKDLVRITHFELTRFAGDVSSAVMPALPFSILSTGLLLTSAVSNGVKAVRNRSPTALSPESGSDGSLWLTNVLDVNSPRAEQVL